MAFDLTRSFSERSKFLQPESGHVCWFSSGQILLLGRNVCNNELALPWKWVSIVYRTAEVKESIKKKKKDSSVFRLLIHDYEKSTGMCNSWWFVILNRAAVQIGIYDFFCMRYCVHIIFVYIGRLKETRASMGRTCRHWPELDPNLRILNSKIELWMCLSLVHRAALNVMCAHHKRYILSYYPSIHPFSILLFRVSGWWNPADFKQKVEYNLN